MKKNLFISHCTSFMLLNYVLFFHCYSIYTYPENFDSNVTLTGRASASIVADQVSLAFTFEEKAETLTQVTEVLKLKAKNLLAQFSSIGLTDNEMIVFDVKFSPQYQDDNHEAIRFTPLSYSHKGQVKFFNVIEKKVEKFIASIKIEVRISNFELIPSLVDTAVNQGIAKIGKLKFSSTQILAEKEKLKQEALLSIKEQKEWYEKEFRIKIDQLTVIKEEFTNSMDYEPISGMLGLFPKNVMEELSDQLEGKTIHLSLFLTCTFKTST